MIRFDQEQTDTVRIALNASFLQRLIGTGYYFYDDISVPLLLPLVKEGDSGCSSSSNHDPQKRPLLLLEQKQHDDVVKVVGSTSISSSSSDQLGRLWIQLCSRLAQKEREYQHKHQKYLVIFLILWLVAMTLLILLISDVYELPPFLLLLIPALLAVSTKWVFICLPEKHGIYCTKKALSSWEGAGAGSGSGLEQELYFQEIQSIVDDLAPSFAEIGYTLDYVEDFRSNCPFLAYIRMTEAAATATATATTKYHDDESSRVLVKGGCGSNKNGRATSDDDSDDDYVLVMDEPTSSVSSITVTTSSSSSSSSSSLSERLRMFQWEAWEEHSGQVADRIQQQHHHHDAKSTNSSDTLLGIPIQKLFYYRSVIFYASIPIGFFWLCLNSGITKYLSLYWF